MHATPCTYLRVRRPKAFKPTSRCLLLAKTQLPSTKTPAGNRVAPLAPPSVPLQSSACPTANHLHNTTARQRVPACNAPAFGGLASCSHRLSVAQASLTVFRSGTLNLQGQPAAPHLHPRACCCTDRRRRRGHMTRSRASLACSSCSSSCHRCGVRLVSPWLSTSRRASCTRAWPAWDTCSFLAFTRGNMHGSPGHDGDTCFVGKHPSRARSTQATRTRPVRHAKPTLPWYSPPA